MRSNVITFVPMNQMPNRLRELRKGRGWTLDRVATAAGCSIAQIADLETGRRQLTVRWMKQLAPVFAIEPAEFLLAEHNSAVLTDDERYLIDRYREANDDQRAQLTSMADVIVPYMAEPPHRRRA